MPDPGPLPRLDDFHGGPAPLVVRLDLVGGRLELAGRLDHRTAHLVHDAMSVLLQIDHGVWVQDVEALSGCDHSGLRAIGTAYRRALRHAWALTLVGSPAWLLVALGRLRLDHHLLAPAGMDGDPAAA